jgi:hypothetical protein
MQIKSQTFQSVNPNEPEVVRGRGLKHRKLSPNQRRDLAADLLTGQQRFEPSLEQVCWLLGTTPVRVRAELKVRATRNGNGQADAVRAFVESWSRLSDSEREAAIKAIGVGAVWDVISRVIA